MEKYFIDKKIHEEMEYAESVLNSWGVSWNEYPEKIFLLEQCRKEYDFNNPRAKQILKEHNVEYKKEIPYFPLAQMLFDDGYYCYADAIVWDNIISNNNDRSIVFQNDGKIFLEKGSRRCPKIEMFGNNEYNANYNVLNKDFDIQLTKNNGEDISCYQMAIKEDILLKGYNNVEMYSSLINDCKMIRFYLNKNSKDEDVEFVYVPDENNIAQYGKITIKTRKGNGKINGTYVVEFDRATITIKYGYRKGKWISLADNPDKVAKFANLLIEVNQKIAKLLDMDYHEEKYHYISLSDIQCCIEHLDTYCIEKKCDNAFKEILDEIPLEGLKERMVQSLNPLNRQTLKSQRVRKN